MQEEKLYPRRWAILVAMTCILVAIQFSFILPGGAAITVMMTYEIDPMAFSMVMSIPYLSGFLFAVLAGILADRIGINKVLVGGMVIAFVGACGRALSGASYEGLFGWSFVMGFAMAALNANSAKLLRIWFPGTANSFAMGVYTAGMSGGAAIALWYGSRVLDATALANAWWLSTALIAVGAVIWIVVYRKHPDGEGQARESIGQYIGTVLKNREVWGISLFAFLVFGMTNVNGMYMVAAVTTLAGDPSVVAQAGDLSTLNTVIACVASMVLPVVFVARFKNMRIPALICFAGTAICFSLIYFLPYGPITWVFYIICPIFMASLMPITKMLPALLPSVKKEHLGAVGGVQATLQNMGMFLVASYVLSPIATAVDPTGSVAYYQVIYVGVAIVCMVAFLSMFLFANVRSSVAGKIEDDLAAAKLAEEG